MYFDEHDLGCEDALVRIVIAGGQALFGEALAATLALQKDFRVAGYFSSPEDALALVKTTPVDLLLLSTNCGPEAESDFIGRARRAGIRGGVLVVTGEISDRERSLPLTEGCAGIFLKSQPMSLLHQRIRAAARASSQSGRRSERDITGPARSGAPVRARLTPREIDVLRGVFDGCSNKEIAADLRISENTVKTFLQQLFDKTGARTRSRLVRTAIEVYRDEIAGGEPAKGSLARAAAG